MLCRKEFSYNISDDYTNRTNNYISERFYLNHEYINVYIIYQYLFIKSFDSLNILFENRYEKLRCNDYRVKLYYGKLYAFIIKIILKYILSYNYQQPLLFCFQ